MKIPHKFRSFDGTRLAYRVWGKPADLTPVVFCSGIACDDVYWLKLAPKLSEERLVITWDYPWHGDSGPPGDRREITVGSLARHCHEITQRESVPPAAFIGHSMGVQVAFEYFRFFPEEVAALITIAGGFARTVGYLYGTNIGEFILAGMQAAARLQPDMAAAAWRALMNPAIADPLGRGAGLIGHAPAEVMNHYFEHLRNLDPQGLFDMFREGHRHSAEDLLEHINVPTLILHGKADVMTPFVIAQKMAVAIPGAELVGVEGGGHTLPGEDPDLIHSTVQEFLHKNVDSTTERGAYHPFL